MSKLRLMVMALSAIVVLVVFLNLQLKDDIPWIKAGQITEAFAQRIVLFVVLMYFVASFWIRAFGGFWRHVSDHVAVKYENRYAGDNFSDEVLEVKPRTRYRDFYWCLFTQKGIRPNSFLGFSVPIAFGVVALSCLLVSIILLM